MMRRLIVSEFISLDGVIEDPNWSAQFSTPEQVQFKFDELKACDALLLGRVTYEGFAAAWPQITNQVAKEIHLPDGFADRMNNYPKFVVSKTLHELKWNNSHLVTGEIADAVLALKEQPGRDILVAGSSVLINSLMEYDLIDEYRLMFFPIVLGQGKRLFGDHAATKRLKHVDTKTFASGVSVLTYHR